jgi:hypothetical protein
MKKAIILAAATRSATDYQQLLERAGWRVEHCPDFELAAAYDDVGLFVHPTDSPTTISGATDLAELVCGIQRAYLIIIDRHQMVSPQPTGDDNKPWLLTVAPFSLTTLSETINDLYFRTLCDLAREAAISANGYCHRLHRADTRHVRFSSARLDSGTALADGPDQL